MDYTAWNFTQKDNFCQVDVDRTNKEIIVRSIDQHGKPIVTSTLALAEF